MAEYKKIKDFSPDEKRKLWRLYAKRAAKRRKFEKEDYLKITKELRQAIRLDHMKETGEAALQAALE